ncbi:MAG: hypothetical protein DRI01_08535 [Chloroflexi bacterium]|nr:MAG: hypothetical protein DRI01_08535 [Chloroflexota bacterium]
MKKRDDKREFATWQRKPIIPSVWPTEKSEDFDDSLKELEELELFRFMQECRERTAAMKNSEKCAKCKLRFRCYTEITRKPKAY